MPPVNSWFFVPLLLAGGGLSLQNAERQWSAQHPVLAVGWQAAVSQLRRSPPVPLSRFLSVLEALQDVAALDGRRVPAAEALLVPSLREAGTALPTHTLVHFRWVLERCLTPHSYVPASAQEALLQVFLSERVASDLSVLADRLRSRAQPAPPVVPLQPAALPVPDQPLPAPERDPSPAPTCAETPCCLSACTPASSLLPGGGRWLRDSRPRRPAAGRPASSSFSWGGRLPRDPRPRRPAAGGRRPARAQLPRSLRGSP